MRNAKAERRRRNEASERWRDHARVNAPDSQPAYIRECSQRVIGQVMMNERSRLSLILGVCAVLLVIGFVFSARITDGIAQAAHQEATQQSPVPTPPSLLPAKATAAKAAPAHG